jgi:hypothetical protein
VSEFPTAILVATGFLGLQATVLFWLVRVPICSCGTIKLWHVVVHSSENSRHIFDWNSFSRIIHGFGFYLLTWLILPRTQVVTRFAFAVGFECACTLSMIAGFALARMLPISAIVGLAVAMELVVGYIIRDNLTLNILMLFYPIDGIRAWQAGG